MLSSVSWSENRQARQGTQLPHVYEKRFSNEGARFVIE